eukprot:Skav217520  [mRNA]  locus=scaffold647:242806:246940:- [translate_table: standard]
MRVVVREHLRVFVATSNWLVMGRPKTFTAPRQPCSAAQSRMLNELEHSLRLFYRLSPGPSSGLDRSFGKFSSVGNSLDELSKATMSLRHELDSYCRGQSSSSPSDHASVSPSVSDVCQPSEDSCQARFDSGAAPAKLGSGNPTALPLNPDRVQFKHAPQFEAEQFMNDPLLKAGFLDPRHLRSPQDTWPRVKHARVMCSRDDLFKLFRKWDDVHSFQLLDASASESKYRCGLFAVYKSEEKDRQILNPIPENGRTLCMNKSTLTLAHGSLLCNLFLDEHEDLVIGADDLEDFYHCFKVGTSHAHRNHIHGVFPAEMFKDFNAWDPKFAGKQVVGCFSTLAMGTSYAVEVAQHVHTNLLVRAGVLDAQKQVCYRKPLPRSPVLLLLCIDDLAVLQKVPRNMPAACNRFPREDLRLLGLADAAYKKVGLRTSQKKAVRNSFHSTILGGEIDGRRGSVSAPRLRVLVLAKLTLKLVQIGWSSKHLLEQIIGCWIFVLLFRRPLLSLFNDVFHEGEHVKDRHECFQLTTGCKQELLLVSIWAPFAYTNLRAQPHDQIFCSDASLHGGGVCTAPFSRSGTLELCRISEQKGFYTRIDGSTLGRYTAHADEGISGSMGIPPPLQEGFLWDFCEVFRGTGHLSQAHREAGFRVHPGFDIRDGSLGDVLRKSTFLCIIGLIARRVVRCWHVAPVCTTFGTLRRPRLRSILEPFGFQPDEVHTHEGNQFAMRGGFILWLCLHYSLVCSMEQPGGSVMYYLDIFTRLQANGVFQVRFPFCGYGTPFQKLSSWLGNNPLLRSLAARCQCGRAGKHFRVQGVFDRRRLRAFCKMCSPSVEAVFGKAPTLGQHVAHFSAGYPLPLCRRVATLNLKFLETDESPQDEVCLQRPSSSPQPWIGELSRSLPWRKLLQYTFKNPNHININEHLSYRSLIKHLAKSKPSSRFAALLDSRVVIGANVKGRSSSTQLNFYLGSTLPYVIGGDLYPHLLHVGSGDNASDDISRFVKLRAPSSEQPPWLQALVAGDPLEFDQVREADSLVSGVSLEPTANRHPATNKRRETCYDSFTKWIHDELHLEVSQDNFPPDMMSTALIAFGKHLFYTGAPKYFFAETINAVIDHFPSYRSLVSSAWATLKKWEEAEPAEPAMIMPSSVIRAAVSLALLWGWKCFAAAILLGFHGLLRPNEILPLKRGDLVLPRDVLSPELVCYVKLVRTKTSRFMQRQHARISDEVSVLFLDAVFGCMPAVEPLFNCSQAMFRTRWNRLFGALGLPTNEKLRGVTPKSLRGSGASWMFHYTEDINRILWRGRWQSKRTLEHYLQDVMGQVLLSDLPRDQVDRIFELSQWSSSLLFSAIG